MKQVVEADLFMEPISIVNKLPNTCNKPEAKRLGAKHVSDDQHEEILDEIARRAALETKCLTMNPKAAVIPRAAALMTATLTVTRAVQITSKTSYVPSLPLCCCSLLVGSNILVVLGC
jgi:hypothetical protein